MSIKPPTPGTPGFNEWRDLADAVDAAGILGAGCIDTAQSLPARVLAMCKARGWSLHWTHRGAYLHLEASELIESLRGKRGDPLGEAADVLLVLMSITESNGLPWDAVLAQCVRTVEKLEAAPRYKGEEFTDAAAGVEPTASPSERTCPDCNGSGLVDVSGFGDLDACDGCGGTGALIRHIADMKEGGNG